MRGLEASEALASKGDDTNARGSEMSASNSGPTARFSEEVIRLGLRSSHHVRGKPDAITTKEFLIIIQQ